MTPPATRGRSALRVYAAVPAGRTTPEDFDAIAKRYPDDPILKTGLATITLDGSVESQTAAMLAPYAPKGSTDGELRMTRGGAGEDGGDARCARMADRRGRRR